MSQLVTYDADGFDFTFTTSDESEIIVDPSPELIADEYEHKDNGKGVLHIFYVSQQKDNCKLIRKTFEKWGYKVADENIHKFRKKEEVAADLNKIAENIKEDDSSLIIFMLGFKSTNVGCIALDKYEHEVYIKDVWSKFLLVDNLRYKPKIFVYHAIQNSVTHDSIRRTDSKYDAPIEADLFIVFKTSLAKQPNNFIQSMCENIAKHGEYYDIFDLVTLVNNKDDHHLIISTLTRKFYVTPSVRLRGNLLNLEKGTKEMKQALGNIFQFFDSYDKESKNDKSKVTGSVTRLASSNTSLTFRGRSNSSTSNGSFKEKPRWKY